MNYRFAEVLAPQDLGASGTKIIDIDVVDPVSRLTVGFYPTGGSDLLIGHPAKCITKIELIDGSDVLYSLSGFEGQALNIFEAPVPMAQELDMRNGGVPRIKVDLDFGRFLWDTDLAFLPTKFTNPQLKLTWNEALYDASVSSHMFFVIAHCFDEKSVSPVGFLMNKEIKAYQPVTGSYEYTDLPTDYVMRKLVIRADRKGGGVRSLCQEIRLSEDNDKRVPINGDINYLRTFLDPLVNDAVDFIRVNADVNPDECYVTPHNVLSAVGILDTADKVGRVYLYAGGYIIVESETAAHGMNLAVRGRNPHGCICIPFGKQTDMADWYDVTRLGSLRLRILGGPDCGAGYNTQIVTQQYRPY